MGWHPCAALLLCTALLSLAPSTCLGSKHVDVKLAQDTLLEWILKSPHMDPVSFLPAEHRHAFAQHRGLLTHDLIAHLSALTIDLKVEVRLVGFDGLGSKNLNVAAQDLIKYLRALRAEKETVVLTPQIRDLGLSADIHFSVTKADAQLSAQIQDAVFKAGQTALALDTKHLSGYPAEIPYRVVDDILRTDAYRDGTSALTIYLLNPAGIKAGRKYIYTYDEAQEGGHHTGCHGSHWVSSSKYLWIDLVAGPSSYGPGRGQPGSVMAHSLPHPSHYMDHTLPKALLPDLAALSWSAVQHFVWPPLQHLPPLFKPTVILQVVHIFDTLGPPTGKLSLTNIKGALHAALGGMQDIQAHEAWVSITTCTLCVAAYSDAMRIRTARDEEVYWIAAKTTRFLDTAILYNRLSTFKDGIFGDAGIHMNVNVSQHVLPIFIFHVSDTLDPLLLTGGRKAEPMSDMVIAVTSKVGTFANGHMCEQEVQFSDSVDVTREVLAAVLTTGWGLVNTSTSYTTATGPGINHLWSVGATPFGPLSQASHVSAPLAALLPRNLVVAHLRAAVPRAVRVLKGFEEVCLGGKVVDGCSIGQGNAVRSRMNILAFKVEQLEVALSVMDHKKALGLARTMIHDVDMLEKLALKVSRSLDKGLHCSAGPGLLTIWWAPVSAALLWPVALYLRARFTRPKYDKMY